MLYNKSKNRKLNDKKVLHKIKKRWIVVSAAILMSLGGGIVTSHALNVHADPTGNQQTGSVNTAKENVNSQLTSSGGDVKASKSMPAPTSQSSQHSSSAASSLNDNSVTSQAKNLHSQILNNNLRHNMMAVHSSASADLGQKSTAKSGTSKKSHPSQQVPDKTVKAIAKNPNASSNGSNNTATASDYGTVSIQYENVSDNKLIGNTTSTIGLNGTPFNSEHYRRSAPLGYKSAKVLQNVTTFKSSLPQTFIMGVTPVVNNESDRNQIVIRYVNDDDGGITVGPDTVDSDDVNTPFDILQNEDIVPNGYDLDTRSGKNELISYNGKDQMFLPNTKQNITYKPGVQLIQIGLVPISNPNSDVQMTVDYVDVDNKNQKVDSDVIYGHGAFTSKDLSKYTTTDVPNNYQFVNTKNVPTKFAPNVTMYIGVKPVHNNTSNNNTNNTPDNTPKSDVMTINYMDGSQMVGTNTIQFKDSGTSVPFTQSDLAKATQNVPSNYQLTGNNANVPKDYTPNATMNIGVEPIMGSMTIEYDFTNGEPMGSSYQINGVNGKPFNVSPYETNVPSGYNYAGSANNVPADFTNGHVVNIMVKPAQTNNNNSNNNSNDHHSGNSSDQTKTDQVIVNYVDNGKIVHTTKISGNDGSQITPDDVSPYVPTGYQYSKNGQQPATFSKNATVEVLVNPIAPAEDTVNVKYKNSDGDVVHTSTISGNDGSQITPSDVTPEIPSDYQYAPNDNQQSDTFSNGSTININVVPVKGTIDVKYVDVNTKQSVGSDTQTGNVDSQLDLAPYENKLSDEGYYVVSTNGSTAYTKGNHDVTINVAKRTDQVVVNYVNGDGKIVRTAKINGTDGSPVTQSDVQSDLPQGYRYDPNNQQANTFSNNATVSVNVLPSTQSVPVYYEDNGSIVGKASDQGSFGSKINNLDQYKNKLPKGYNFISFSNNNPTTYTDDHKAVIINVGKATQMAVNFVDANGKPIGKAVINGTEGQPINWSKYSNIVPNGYHVTKSNGKLPAKFNNGSVNFTVARNTDSMTVRYYANGQVIGTATISGPDGSSITKSDVNSQLPKDYHVSNANAQTFGKFQKGSRNVVINVTKNSSNHAEEFGTIDIEYVDSNNNSIGNGMVSHRKTGTPFNLNNYRGDVPQGYQIDKVVQGGNVTAYSNGIQQVVFEVSPLKQAPSTDQMTVNFVGPDGKSLNTPAVIYGTDGQSINWSKYGNIVPSGYHVTGANGQLPSKFIPNGSVSFTVASNTNPNNGNHQPSTDQMIIDFVGPDGQSVNTPAVIYGTDGQSINWSKYSNIVPSGYHVTGTINQLPSKFIPNGSVMFNVASNEPTHISDVNTKSTTHSDAQSQNATVSLIYKDVSGNHPIVREYSVSGLKGSSIDYAKYENGNYVPQGYQVTDLTDGTSTYEPNADMVIYVRKMNSDNNAPHTTTPSDHTDTNKDVEPTHHSVKPTAPRRSVAPKKSKSNVKRPGYAKANGNKRVQANTAAGIRSMLTYGNANEDMAGISNLNPVNNGLSNVQPITPSRNAGKLPQTGEAQNRSKEFAAILIALSANLGALGYAIDRRRRRDN